MTRNRVTTVPYWPLRRAERRSDRAAVERASQIVTNSAFSAARIRDAYGRAATPLPLGTSAIFAPLSEPADPAHVLSVGALLPTKGHALAIRATALARLPLPVVIVTPREDNTEAARLERIAAETGVALEIRVAISDETLAELYRRALGTVYLAQAEPFGLVSIEAQACGSPVIVADEGGLPETVIEGVTGWQVRRDPIKAAQCLARLADPSVRRPMAARAAVHGRTFSWERSAQAMESALAGAVYRRPRRER